MRVGILTFHTAHNYGAMLQTYALKKACEGMGANTSVIDYRPEYINRQYDYFGISQNAKLNILKLYNLKGNMEKKSKFEAFKNKYFSLIPFDTTETFDTLLYGSDQIWNPDINGEFDEVFFGHHNIKTRRNTAYAASIGKSRFSDSELKRFSEISKCLDAISVREETAKSVLQSICKKEISVTLDPTLLLDLPEWNRIAVEPHKREAYILVYEVNKIPQTMQIASELSRRTGIKILEISYCRTKLFYGHKVLNGVGPGEFVGLFKNAAFIVTSSFHGTAFSIINRKNFYTIAHRSYGSRMNDLLCRIGLSDRMIEALPGDIQDIDYNAAERVLKEIRECSLHFLSKNIKEGI